MSSRGLSPELSSAGSSLPPNLPSTLCREHPSSTASPPALHPMQRASHLPCLPTCPVPLHREHPGSSLPHLVLLQLCCFSVTETCLAFPLYFHSQVSFYSCLTFIPYRASVSDFVRLAFCFETQLYLKNSLLFCILLLLAAWLLFRCLQNSLSVAFPMTSLCLSAS